MHEDSAQVENRSKELPSSPESHEEWAMDQTQEEFVRALRAWMKTRGLNQSRLADLAGVGQSQVSECLGGKKPPSFEFTSKVVKALGVDMATFFQPEDPFDGYTLVPKSSARPRGGEGGLETDDEFDGLYAFKTDFLLRKGHPTSMKLFEVVGDSMMPTIPPGALVLVDESQSRPITSGKIYLVRWGDELMLKRIFQEPGLLSVRSDNSIFPAKQFEPSEVAILGKAVWVGHEI